MKTSNIEPSGQHAGAITRGHIGARRAGTPGHTSSDTKSNSVTAPETQFIGATVSGEDGEIAYVTINGTGQTATNSSGATLAYGDVVVLDTNGSVITTTTAQATRPVGVVQIGGGSGNPVSVAFAGYVAQVTTTGTVNAGDYLETSTTAGKARSSGVSRRIGSFGRALAAGPNPSALLFGVPDAAAGTSGSGGGSAGPWAFAGGDEDAVEPLTVPGPRGATGATGATGAGSSGPSAIAYSSGDVTVTGSLADMTGCSVSLAAGTYIVTGIFDVLVNNALNDRTFEGHLDSGGVDQTNYGDLVAPGLVNVRAMISQSWRLVLAATTTVKLRAKYSGGTAGDFTVKAQTVIAAWGAGTSVASDGIWDAAGDLAVGTGADTAGRLAKGADGTRLEVESGALAWKAVRAPGRATAPATDLSTTSGTAVAISSSMDVTVTVGQSGLLMLHSALVLRMGGVTADATIQASVDGGTTKVDVGREGWDGTAMRKTVALGYIFSSVTPGAITVKLYWLTTGGNQVFLDGASRGSAQLGSWVMAVPL